MMVGKRAILAGLVLMAAPQAALAEDAWSFKVLPYIWMSGLTGETASFPGTPPVDVDLSFIDILENLDIAAFVVAEARKGDLFFRSEMAYASISASADTPGGFFSDADLTAKTFQGALAVGYTINRGPITRLMRSPGGGSG
jgi:hypothetical protein